MSEDMHGRGARGAGKRWRCGLAPAQRARVGVGVGTPGARPRGPPDPVGRARWNLCNGPHTIGGHVCNGHKSGVRVVCNGSTGRFGALGGARNADRVRRAVLGSAGNRNGRRWVGGRWAWCLSWCGRFRSPPVPGGPAGRVDSNPRCRPPSNLLCRRTSPSRRRLPSRRPCRPTSRSSRRCPCRRRSM